MRKQSLIALREALLRDPRTKKWINECVCCHQQGYNPDMPENISKHEYSMACYEIKKCFSPPLALDEDGYCQACAKFKNK